MNSDIEEILFLKINFIGEKYVGSPLFSLKTIFSGNETTIKIQEDD